MERPEFKPHAPLRATGRAFCLLLLLGLAPVRGADEDATPTLEQLRGSFQQQQDLLREPVRELDRLYAAQLETLREQVRESGDLDKVLIVDEEKRHIRDGGDPPEQTFPGLERLRGIYRENLARREAERERELATFLEAYAGRLEALAWELTRQDRLQEAVAARDEAQRARLALPGAGAAAASEASPAAPGRIGGIGFGRRPDPVGNSPRGITDIVAIELWEREALASGWLALRANGTLVSDQERRLTSTRDHFVAFDCSRGGGILLVKDDGTVDSSLCRFQPPEDKLEELRDIASVALARTEGPLSAEAAVAVRRDGSLVWWGPAAERAGVQGPPAEARSGVARVTSSRGVFSALKTDGSLVVWSFTPGGDGRVALPAEYAESRFTQVAMSPNHFLALKQDGSVVSWGVNTEGQREVPPDLGPCTEVRILYNVLSLARREDGTWAAWGREYGDIRSRLEGASGIRHIAGRLFPPGEYAFAVWIEE